MVERLVANEKVEGSNPSARSNEVEMIKGIGYLEYCQQRMNEGFPTQGNKDGTGYEQKGNERYVLYFARSHIEDFETGQVARGHMKIGQAKYLSAVMRTRNQPGNDFRCYAEIVMHNLEQTFEAEALVKRLYNDRRIKLTQNQQELYDFKDEELLSLVNNVKKELGFEPKDVIIYV